MCCCRHQLLLLKDGKVLADGKTAVMALLDGFSAAIAS